MTVRDVLNELAICEITIKELTEMQDRVCNNDSDTIQDAFCIIKKYMEELKNKCIK